MRWQLTRRCTLALMGVIALSLLPVTPADASSRCPAGSLCLWSKPRFDGKRSRISTPGDVDLSTFDNKASSLKNATESTVFLFTDPGSSGEARCFVPGQKVRKLSSVTFDNVASSAKIPTSTETCVDGSPPTVAILSPEDGETRSSAAPIPFVGDASDPKDGSLSGGSIVWVSSIDGQIGTGTSFSASLTAGAHTITATATDADGNTNSDSIQLTVT